MLTGGDPEKAEAAGERDGSGGWMVAGSARLRGASNGGRVRGKLVSRARVSGADGCRCGGGRLGGRRRQSGRSPSAWPRRSATRRPPRPRRSCMSDGCAGGEGPALSAHTVESGRLLASAGRNSFSTFPVFARKPPSQPGLHVHVDPCRGPPARSGFPVAPHGFQHGLASMHLTVYLRTGLLRCPTSLLHTPRPPA